MRPEQHGSACETENGADKRAQNQLFGPEQNPINSVAVHRLGRQAGEQQNCRKRQTVIQAAFHDQRAPRTDWHLIVAHDSLTQAASVGARIALTNASANNGQGVNVPRTIVSGSPMKSMRAGQIWARRRTAKSICAASRNSSRTKAASATTCKPLSAYSVGSSPLIAIA